MTYNKIGDKRVNADGSVSTLVDNGDGTIGTLTTGCPKPDYPVMHDPHGIVPIPARKKSIQDEILHGMALAFFASAFADMQEEKAADGEPNVNPGPGGNWLNVLPDEIDPAAIHAARTLQFDMERENAASLEYIFERAKQIQFDELESGDRELTPAMFGHYCAMQAMGHGVGLRDAFGQAVYDAIKVPYVEFGAYGLEKDY